jgi:hypothetical protein
VNFFPNFTSHVTIWLPVNIIEDKLRLKKPGRHLGNRKRERFHGNIEISQKLQMKFHVQIRELFVFYGIILEIQEWSVVYVQCSQDVCTVKE